MGKTAAVGKTTGKLTHFLVEPFTPHDEKEEYYAAIRSEREADVVYFSAHGGIYVEENWEKVSETRVPVLKTAGEVEFNVSAAGKNKEAVVKFLRALHRLYVEGGFSYLEINPFTFSGGAPVPLDLVARLDDTALPSPLWEGIEFPPSFGDVLSAEESFVKTLDEQSGASLKLTVLNPKGRVWTMVAGGGASVIYADTVCDLGFSKELANYGEYSGDPSEELTCQYAKTLLDLMTREKNPAGKVLLIGGGIANFTDVAKTFSGIIKALGEFKEKLKENKVAIYVRRGGPNYQQGLEKMRKLGETLGVPIKVYGPETHMTKIVSLALGGSGCATSRNCGKDGRN